MGGISSASVTNPEELALAGRGWDTRVEPSIHRVYYGLQSTWVCVISFAVLSDCIG